MTSTTISSISVNACAQRRAGALRRRVGVVMNIGIGKGSGHDNRRMSRESPPS
ncbi:MAG TPA: hypothetical protein PLB41_20340 [Rubrivivax sp.]|nr:hypothetical protein [Rubrivivax sp.]